MWERQREEEEFSRKADVGVGGEYILYSTISTWCSRKLPCNHFIKYIKF
jgi:hypothetical protein